MAFWHRREVISVSLIFVTYFIYFIFMTNSSEDEHQGQLSYLRIPSDFHVSVLGAPLTTVDEGHALFHENSTIFVIETNSNLSNFKPALLCAVESALRLNSELNVAVITLSTLAVENLPFFFGLLSNVSVHTLDVDRFMRSSQVSKFWLQHRVHNSTFFLSHLSDLLRYVLIFNYGGIYIDQDVIVTKSFHTTPNCFVVPESYHYMNGAILRFTKHHPFMQLMLSKVASEYDGQTFSSVGPYLMSSALKEFCQKESERFPFVNMQCPNDLKVLQVRAAYPLQPRLSYLFYIPGYVMKVFERANQPLCYAVHYFSSMRKYWESIGKIHGNDVFVNEGQPLYELMKAFCPLTEQHALRPFIHVPWTDNLL